MADTKQAKTTAAERCGSMVLTIKGHIQCEGKEGHAGKHRAGATEAFYTWADPVTPPVAHWYSDATTPGFFKLPVPPSFPDPAAPPVAEEATALLPCPFCGGRAHVQDADEGSQFYVACNGHGPGCFAAMGEGYDAYAIPAHSFHAAEDAIAAWNQRATPSPTRESEVELPSIDLTEDDWGTAIDSVDSQDSPSSTGEAVKLACRERQLKAALAEIENLKETLFTQVDVNEAYASGAKLGPCCRKPWCGGDCTCEICAPELAIRDLKARIAQLELALSLNCELHGCGSSRCTAAAYHQTAVEMMARIARLENR